MWKAYCVYTSHAGSVIPRLADVCNQRVYIPSSAKFCVRLSKEEEDKPQFDVCFPNLHGLRFSAPLCFQPQSCKRHASHREETKERHTPRALLLSAERLLVTDNPQWLNAHERREGSRIWWGFIGQKILQSQIKHEGIQRMEGKGLDSKNHKWTDCVGI